MTDIADVTGLNRGFSDVLAIAGRRADALELGGSDAAVAGLGLLGAAAVDGLAAAVGDIGAHVGIMGARVFGNSFGDLLIDIFKGIAEWLYRIAKNMKK